jgi:hypothetical protein
MSQNDTAIKPCAEAERGDFLAALYSGAKPDLLLELRCLHPEAKAARVLWTPIGNQ